MLLSVGISQIVLGRRPLSAFLTILPPIARSASTSSARRRGNPTVSTSWFRPKQPAERGPLPIRTDNPHRLRPLWLSRRFSPSSRHRFGHPQRRPERQAAPPARSASAARRLPLAPSPCSTSATLAHGWAFGEMRGPRSTEPSPRPSFGSQPSLAVVLVW